MFKKQEITLLNAVTPVAITSSTDATPIVMTVASHGFSTGDKVMIYGHTTNVAANGIFQVEVVNVNSFKLKDELTGVDVVGSGAGAGANGIVLKAPAVLLCSDFRNIELQVSTAGTATTTIKIAGSLGKPFSESEFTSPRYDYPNMGATISKSNPYTFMQIVDLATGIAYTGATGIVVAGTDITTNFEVNINSTKYLTVVPISWSQGAITVKALLTNVV